MSETQETKTLAALPGCADHDKRDWQIGPVGIHRDSDSYERSNWRVMLARYEALDPAGNDHEVFRFGHWAVGWVDEVATRPGSPCAIAAGEMRASLAEYCLLSDDDHSTLEVDEADEFWDSYQSRDVRNDVFKELQSRYSEDSSDEIETTLYGIDDDTWFEIAVHNAGNGREIDEQGCYRFRPTDILRIADTVAERFLESDDGPESEVQPTE